MKSPAESARERFAGKRVTVVGLAREGVSLARFLARSGAEVTATDHAQIESLAGAVAALEGIPVRLVLGGHPRELFLESEILFVSPGVSQHIGPLVESRGRGIPISSATQLFFELCRGRIVGVTGSAGKTTTTALTGQMLQEAGLAVFVGGNIGVPLIENLEEIGPEAWALLEMSSFQLETLPYSPPIAAILNLTPNHLDRHSDMESYVAAKANIVRHQRPEDWAILNADDNGAARIRTVARTLWFSLEKRVEGGYLRDSEILVRRDGSEEVVCTIGDVHLPGRHNLANVVASCAIASAAGAPVQAMRAAVQGFSGVPHRLEKVGTVDGVIYYNDSIATAPERAMASIRSFDEPLVLIAGGRNKKLPLGDWARLIRERVRALVLIGDSAGEIEEAVREASGHALPRMLHATSLEDAVDLARGEALPGDVVLLAPGGTSFDMFKDFEERGERFRQCVARLRAGG